MSATITDLDLDALARLAEAANSDPLGSTVLADFITVFGPDVVCALITGLRTQEALVRELVDDKKRIDWLEDQVVECVYLDDGTLIDVAGHSVRKAIDAALAKVKP